VTCVAIFQEKCAPAPFEALPTAIPLLALPRHAMAHNIRALTVGAVKYLKNHESTLVCWSFSASRPRIEDSRSTPLRHLQEERCAGQVLIPSCSLRFTRLSHSETVGDTAWAGPHRSHPPPTHAAPVWVGAREVLGHQTPGGMKLAARQGKAPVWGGARHTCCSAVGRPRCLNTRCGPTGRRPRVRKEPDDATERCHDA